MDIKKHIGKDLDAKIKEVAIQRRGVNSNLHKRGSMGKLSVEKGHCTRCGHNRILVGNPMGHQINKCARCKEYL